MNTASQAAPGARSASGRPPSAAASRLGSHVTLESVPCLLCGGRDVAPVVAVPDHVTRLGGFFHVVCCRSCGLQFTNPRPVAAELSRFYPDDYRPWAERHTAGWFRPGLQRRLKRAILRVDFAHPPQPVGRVERLLARLGRTWIRRSRQRETWIPFRAPGRLLDFGCGRGDFLVEMRNFGWTVEGVEISAAAAAALEQRTGLRVHVGSLPHSDLEPESFDVVAMRNSLEHVPHPRDVLRAARQVLRTGGLIVVGVPNIDSWAFRRFREHWWQLDLPRHLTHFTPQTLSEMLVREGFTVRSVDHVGRPGWLRKSARRAFASGEAARSARLLSWKWPALAACRWSERRSQADFIRAIAEKT